MTVDVTLARGGTSVDVPLLLPAGDMLLAQDIGKPEQSIYDTQGSLDPRFRDQYAQLEAFTVLGRYKGTAAYDDAITLASLIKSDSDGQNLTLDATALDDHDSTYRVAPVAEQDVSLTLGYDPGRRNIVDVQLSLQRISDTRGGGDTTATTPTDTGSGPIQLTNGTTTVDLTGDVTVQRSVGRPNASVQSRTPDDYPRYNDSHRSAYDAFDISFTASSDGATTASDLRSVISPRLRSSSLTLDFNGHFNMGQFDVVPAGSRAFRTTVDSAYSDVRFQPTLQLRVVRDD